MLAIAGPVDALVFTDDIGLTSPEVREARCNRLSHFGFRLDHITNRKPISTDVTRFKIPEPRRTSSPSATMKSA
ncbi:hypothetical protein JW848_09380 [Candidatus Bipolaricaulota bacterium]|nr:hypothetical protein [Candidatus Bipolaricaulota bacterium]